MGSRKWTRARVAIIVVSLSLFSVAAYAETFTVELGSFTTPAGVSDAYGRMPGPAKTRAVVCPTESAYHLRCGEADDPRQLEKIREHLHNANLAPSIVTTDLTDCVPAEQFIRNFGAPILPAGPSPSIPPPDPKENRYADLADPEISGYLDGTAMMVRPGVSTQVMLSNRDLNRIVCQHGPVKDIYYSREKGIEVKIDGDNAFVKFLINSSGSRNYADTPSEFYVVCGTRDVYTLIALPKNIPAQTVSLTAPKHAMEQNLSLFEGYPLEEIIVSLVKDVYADTIPESFTVMPVNKTLNLFREISVLFKQKVIVYGEGLALKEYILTLKPDAASDVIHIEEKHFLVPELARNPLGIALDPQILEKETSARLFVIETHNPENR